MRSRRHARSGGALVGVLLVLIVAAGLAAGWVTLMTAEMQYVETLEQASSRRIQFLNTRAVARQYMLTNAVALSNAPGASVTLAGGAAVNIPASTGTALGSTTRATYNAFNPGNGDGYTLDVVATATVPFAGGGQETKSFRLQAKSRSPMLSGDLLTSNAGAGTSIGGSVDVYGRTLIWSPDGHSYTSLRTMSYTVPPTAGSTLALEDFSGGQLPVSNFPFVPTTNGPIAGAASFNGALDVIHNTSGVNSLWTKQTSPTTVDGLVVDADSGDGITCDGAGVVTLHLDEGALKDVRLGANVTALVLEGQASVPDYMVANAQPSILVVRDQALGATDLHSITLSHRNSRRVALAIRKEGALPTMTINAPQAGSGDWRLLLTLENTPVQWTLPAGSTLSLVGGVQSNAGIDVASGTLALVSDADPKNLDRLTARDAWVEAYETP